MPVAETYELISTQTLSSNQNTVSFTSFPSTYTDLVIIASCKYSSSGGDINVQFNSDTSANYNYGRMVTTSTVVTSANANTVIINNSDATPISVTRINIFNYADTSYWKHVLMTGGSGGQVAGNQSLSIGVWRNTAAITSIQVRSETGSATWESGSKFSLYGITRA